MCFFISDKGRKFFRFLRQTMITGKIPDSNKFVPEKLRWPLFLMNKCIDATLRGEDDPKRWAWLMDTNVIIQSVYDAIKRLNINPKNYNIEKKGKHSNPVTFYKGLIQILTARRLILLVPIL